MSQDALEAKYEEWTPTQAEAALIKNNVNRRLRHPKVDQYVRDMTNGTWGGTAPIVFGKSGNLLDGQHRLIAQCRADVKLNWLVVRNAPDDWQKNMDTGSVRSYEDQLAFNDERYSKFMSPLIRSIHLYELGIYERQSYPVSHAELDATLEAHPEVRITAEFAANTLRTKPILMLAPAVVAMSHWLISQVNGNAVAEEFLHKLLNLADVPEDSAIRAGFSRLQQMRMNKETIDKHNQVALIIKTFNAYAKDEHPKVLYAKSTDKSGKFKLPSVYKVPFVNRNAH